MFKKNCFLLSIFIFAIIFLTYCDDDDNSNYLEYWEYTDTETEMAQWFSEREYLSDTSLWSQYLELDEDSSNYPERGELAAFGMGNSKVFGMLGLNIPLNTITAMLGPYYQNAGGYFGNSSIYLRVDDQLLLPHQEWMWRIRKTDVVISKSTFYNSTLELYTCSTVPRNETALIRKIIVLNNGDTDVSNIEVYLDIAGIPEIDGDYLTQTRGDKLLSIWGRDDDNNAGTPYDDEYRIDMGTISSGAEEYAEMYLFCNTTDASRDDVISSVMAKSFDVHLEETISWWENWMSDIDVPQSPDQKVNDLFDGGIVLIQVQVDQSGATSNLCRYTGAYVRDTYAISKFYLDIGKYDEAKGFLDFILKAYTINHMIVNSTSLDKDFSVYAEPSDPDEFWKTAAFLTGDGKVEVACYIPLAWYEYYKYTGDLDYLADHFDYLKYSLLLQEYTDEGKMVWNGDEDFRYSFNIAMNNGTGIGEDPEYLYYSFNSQVLYVSACEKMAEIAELIGRDDDAATLQAEADFIRAATEEYYWNEQGFYYPAIPLPNRNIGPYPYPFEDISCKTVWHDYHDGTEEREIQNIQSSKDYLMRDDGLFISPVMENTTLLNVINGMVPGYWLYVLTKVGDADAKTVYELYNNFASKSGEFAEMHKSDFTFLHLQYQPSGLHSEEVTARFRPWETAINLYSLKYYLENSSYSWR